MPKIELSRRAFWKSVAALGAGYVSLGEAAYVTPTREELLTRDGVTQATIAGAEFGAILGFASAGITVIFSDTVLKPSTSSDVRSPVISRRAVLKGFAIPFTAATVTPSLTSLTGHIDTSIIQPALTGKTREEVIADLSKKTASQENK